MSQKVGVVLSGGGATGLAHVGVLMALEEAGIPIDYIAGTSAGALVGSMYASGFSPEQIKNYVIQEEYVKMANGELLDDQQFMLRKGEEDASMINFPFSKDSIFKKSLPTNFIKPAYLDYELFRVYGLEGASVGEDFNNLFVPFRCVGADITQKKAVVFKDGKLNSAVRASMTYPFYVNPIYIDGVLYFDGGLYNNFPADVMYDEFNPDYIIGSNVSGNAPPPTDDDLMSQLRNMLMTPTIFSLPCESGIMINQNLAVGTFDFDRAKEAVEIGYQNALPYIDSIRQYVLRNVDATTLANKRKMYLSKLIVPKINQIRAIDNKGKTIGFVEKSFKRDSIRKTLSMDDFRKHYFRTYATPQINTLFPTISLNPKDSLASVELIVSKQKPLALRVGGHFSSRPVNTAFIGLSLMDLTNSALNLAAESYFGKFYGSVKVTAETDIPGTFPIRVTPYFTINRWDYFRSFSTFIEVNKPSFLVQNEMYYGVKFSFPMGNQVKSAINFRNFELEDNYYQSLNFTNLDTTDFTRFDGQTAIFSIENNHLNRKQWASEGHFYLFQMRYVQGREQSIAGSTAEEFYDIRKQHKWLNISLEGQKLFRPANFFKIGLHGKGVVNSQSLFANYTATVLSTTEFSPLPDSKTYFMAEYRAPQYVGLGINLIFSIRDFIDFRIDPYLFQPFRQITKYENGGFGYDDLFKQGTYMAGASIIYHSPVGPLRLTTNYFPKQDNPLSFQLSFGYLIFNDRAIR